MKYLSDYMESKQTALFKKTGTFFAFSNKQFKESAKKNIKYVNMGAGMITPKPFVEEVINGLHKIYKDSIKQDLNENRKERIILRELINHEAFYVGSIDDTVDKLKDYKNITEADILKIYRENWEKHI